MHRIEIEASHPRPDRIAEVSDALERGKVVAMATDTSWAILADPFQRSAADRIREMRQTISSHTSATRPMSLLCGSVSMASQYVIIDQPQFRLLRRLLPGPYTLLLPASRQVPKQLQSKRRAVGIRMPGHAIVQGVMDRWGKPLTGTTARRRNGELVMAAPEIEAELGEWVDVLVESEPFMPGPSTVIDYTSSTPLVLRAGLGEIDPEWGVGEPDEE